jgi:ubiquinone/menaquinone biosynthesis C-methylase UbiE
MIHDAPLSERVAIEQRIWDGINDELFADPSLLQLTHPSYESFFTAHPEYRYAYDYLGPSLAGRRVLELGCGTGVLSVALAASGATVTAVDVSGSSLAVTERRARHFEVGERVRCIQSAAELLDFPAGSFDVFIAKSVVHHLIIDEVMPRIYRFLVPGGRGVIVEPQSNPVLDFAREHLPYPGKESDEHGTDEFFTRAMIERIIGHFDEGEFREFRLLGMLEKLITGSGTGFAARQSRERRVRRYRRVVDPIDATLLRLVPPLRRLAQLVVIRLGRAPAAAKADGARVATAS